MSQKVYTLEPGMCTCVLGDPNVGSRRVAVLKLSGLGALLDPSGDLLNNQFVYTSVNLDDGPVMALSGVVISSTAQGISIQWDHASPREADRVDRAIREYLLRKGKLTAAEAAVPREEESSHPPLPSQRGKRTPAADLAGASSKGQTGGNLPPLRPGQGPAPAPAAPSWRGDPQGKRQAGGKSPPHPAAPSRIGAGGAGAGKPAAPRPAAPHARPAQLTGISPARTSPAGPQEGGRMDVGATIRKKARIVRSADLASVVETVQVLNIESIKGLIKEAVDESVALLGENLAEVERKRLLEEAEETFRERFEAEKAGLEEKTRLLQRQLEKAQTLLKDERGKVLSANQFTVSDKGMVELEQRLGRMFDRAIQKGQVSDDLEKEMRAVVARLLDDERQKIREQAQEAQSDKISLLEKKISRLASSLESAETERDRAQRRAQALEASGGVIFGNILEAGLDDEDPDRERKLSLLKEIVKTNKEMREQLASEGRLPQARERVPAALPQGESEIARSLGVKKSKLQDEEGAAPGGSPSTDPVPDSTPVPAPGAEAEIEEEASGVPVGAQAEVDPDDQHWKPVEKGPGRGPDEAKIRRLGGKV